MPVDHLHKGDLRLPAGGLTVGTSRAEEPAVENHLIPPDRPSPSINSLCPSERLLLYTPHPLDFRVSLCFLYGF
ncbi:hypothetical protein RRG08_034368 [Elysia crispata]|uniref:Uncharacterized protein n=1 Tax=Elysia crispata TaxID=231223 RepID=A0AAE0YCU1_9GAST|nr:hypothetical protein RRG08_034368 [Elysia crispata]